MRKLRAVLWLIMLLAIVGSMVSPPMPTVQAHSWVIDENRVYIDDGDIYLAATPHTIVGSGWVEFELISKRYSGPIDTVWGFDYDAEVRPKNPQVWADSVPHEKEKWVDIPRAGNSTFNNIVSWKVLQWDGTEPNIGNHDNPKLVELTIEEPELQQTYTTIVAYTAYVQHSATSATFYYVYTSHEKEYYTEYYPDYRNFSVTNFETFTYNYQGVNSWHFAKLDTDVEAGKLYKVRIWVDIPFTGLDKFTSKYVWGVKPSGESIAEAKANGHLYLLDPWLSGGWSHRVKFTVNSSDIDSNLTDFPILLYLSTSSGENNEDISFIFDELQSDENRKKIAVTESDGITQRYVEIESWDSANETASLWTSGNITSATDTDFYFYFDSTHANNTVFVGDTNSTPGENVWDSHFKAVYHMADGADTSHIYDSTSNSNDGAKMAANEPNEVGGKVGKAQDFDITNTEYISIPIISSTILTLEGLVYSDNGVTRTVVDLGYRSNTDGNELAIHNGVPRFTAARSGAIETKISVLSTTINSYNYVAVSADGDGTKFYVNTSIDNQAAVTTPLTPGADGGYFNIGYRKYNAWYYNDKIDELRISDIARPPAHIKATKETLWDDLLDWESEESATPTVVTNDVTNINDYTARFNGEVTTTEYGEITERGFDWDTDSGAPYTYNWTENGSWGIGAFTYTASLDDSTTYYVRAKAKNAPGTWSYGDEVNFTTLLAYPLAPTGFTITQISSTSIEITWTKGLDTNYTMIQCKSTGYPASVTDGWAVYNGTEENATDTGLDIGYTGYYYCAWSYNDRGLSNNYAEGHIGGEGMNLLVFIILPIALMAVGFWQKKQALLMAAGLAWAGFAFWELTLASGWDINRLMMYLGWAMAMVCFFETWFVARKSQVIEQAREEEEQYTESYGEMLAQVARLRRFKIRR